MDGYVNVFIMFGYSTENIFPAQSQSFCYRAERFTKSKHLKGQLGPPPTAVWTRIEMCRDFFVKTSLTFWWLLLVFGSGGSGKVKVWPRIGLVYMFIYTKLLALEPSRGP